MIIELPTYKNMENNQVIARSYTTYDGSFMSMTDYGNFAYAWRSWGDKDFREFIVGLNEEYFAGKMYAGLTYVAYGKQYEKAAKRFAEMILTPLQKELKRELESESKN